MTTVQPAVSTLRRSTVPGCELVCDVVPGDGPPVVVLTGATGTRQVSALMMQGLVGRRKLVLPDPRGHGEGVCRHPEHYTWRQLVDDVYDWLDELGIAACALVGTSLGAVVATAVAVERPEVVTALALTSPAVVAVDEPVDPEQDAAIARLTAAFGVAGPPDAEHTAREFSALSGMPLDQARQRLALHRDLESVATYFRTARRDDVPFTVAHLQRLVVPTLVVPGADLVHAPHVGARLAALVPGAHVPDLSGELAEVSDPTEFRLRVFAHVARWLEVQA